MRQAVSVQDRPRSAVGVASPTANPTVGSVASPVASPQRRSVAHPSWDGGAITDVYSAAQGTLLVRYSPGLVVGIALSGLLAFALTGFLGYADDPGVVGRFFAEPWPIFLWLCGLLLTLEASIFRHSALRLRLFAVLTVTMISIAVLGVFYFDRTALETL